MLTAFLDNLTSTINCH